MRSQARLTYNRVAAALGLQPQKGEPVPAQLVPHLQDLYALYHVLAKAREKRGAIDFETIETQMLFDDQGKIENIVQTQRNDAHRLIEECMLAANVCASDFLKSRKHPALYRVHEGPTPEKLEALQDLSQAVRPGSDRRRNAACEGLRQAARPDQGPPRYPAAADGAAAVAQAGAVQPGKRRPFRPRLRGLYPFHFADPALSGPGGASRDQCRARGKELQPGRLGRTRRALLHDRAPRRRSDARRRVLAQVLLHAGPHRRGVCGLDQRGHRFRHIRRAGRCLRRRPGAHLRTGRGLLSFRRRQAPAAGRAQRAALPPRRPGEGEAGARGPGFEQDRFPACRRQSRQKRKRSEP